MEPEKVTDAEKYRAFAAQHLEIFKATVAWEHAILKPPFLLNGGALIAVLTFLGHVWTADPSQNLVVSKWLMILAMILWVLGLVAAGAATLFGYESQFAFLKAFRRRKEADDKDDPELEALADTFGRKGATTRRIWKGGVIASLSFFGIGAVLAIISVL
ncbi:MAG: hypothetical protein IH905_08295 [Proteobacteria bacterium]|nr:hypothetical protein [Pseudomonadota bacterium]